MKKCIKCGKESDNLNANNICPDCVGEVEEKIDEIVAQSNVDDNPTPTETVDSNPGDNFQATVQKRNEAAEEAKEILSATVEEDEEEEPKKWNYLKKGLLLVGVGFIGYGVLGAIKARKQAQNPTIGDTLA